MRRVEFVVVGIPATKGSPRLGRSGRTGRVHFRSDSQRLIDWTAQVRGVLLRARPAGWRRGGDVAYRVELEFCLPRPKGKIARGVAPLDRYDWDKLARAFSDAAAGVLWDNDGAVVDGRVQKRWAGPGEEGVRGWAEVVAIGDCWV